MGPVTERGNRSSTGRDDLLHENQPACLDGVVAAPLKTRCVERSEKCVSVHRNQDAHLGRQSRDGPHRKVPSGHANEEAPRRQRVEHRLGGHSSTSSSATIGGPSLRTEAPVQPSMASTLSVPTLFAIGTEWD